MTPSPDCQAPLAPHAEARLQRNLAGQAQPDPELASRLCLPVRGDHVELGDDGGATYRVGEARLALELPLQRAGALCSRPLPGSRVPAARGRAAPTAAAAAAAAGGGPWGKALHEPRRCIRGL